MAQMQILTPEDIARLRRDLCLAFDNQDKTRMLALSQQIDQIQLSLFRQETPPCHSAEN